MSVAAPDVVAPNRYAHVDWDAVADLVQLVWGRSERADERTVSGTLLHIISDAWDSGERVARRSSSWVGAAARSRRLTTRPTARGDPADIA